MSYPGFEGVPTLNKKRCPHCDTMKPSDEFYKNRRYKTGLSSWCKQCAKDRVRVWDIENRDRKNATARRNRQDNPKDYNAIKARHRARYRDRQVARQWLTQALKTGRRRRSPCEICGITEKIEGHHPNYSRPEYVRWLCFDHHRAVDNGKMSLIEEIINKPT